MAVLDFDQSQKPAAVVLGSGENALSAIYALHRAGVPTILATTDPTDLALRSRLPINKILSAGEGALLEKLLPVLAERTTPPVLFITGDRMLMAVSRARTALAAVSRFTLPDADTIELVVDKTRFCSSPALADAPIARGCALPADGATTAALTRLHYPVVIKLADNSRQASQQGRRLFGSAKALLLASPSALEDSWQRARTQNTDLVVQEYVGGGDIDHYSYFAYVADDGRTVLGYGVRKLRLLPIRHGNATCIELCDDPALRIAGEAVIDALAYRGFVSVCLKYDQDSGGYRCYEVNGRLPLGHAAGHMLGQSLVLAAYTDLTGVEAQLRVRSARADARWITLRSDLRSARQYYRVGELTLLAWLQSLLKVRWIAEWYWRDPYPLLVNLARLLRGK